jgi:hypothetical protein
VFDGAYIKRKDYLHMLSILQRIKEEIWQKTIFADGARWYKDTCKWLRLKQQVYATELKNIMERLIQKIKDRTECFDDHFPCRSESLQHTTYYQLDQNVYSVFASENRQD